MSDDVLDTNFHEIDITNDYMFTTVMQDPQLCMELLGYLLPDSRIRQLKYIRFSEDGSEIVPDDTKTEIQKAIPGYFGFRGMRLDA